MKRLDSLQKGIVFGIAALISSVTLGHYFVVRELPNPQEVLESETSDVVYACVDPETSREVLRSADQEDAIQQCGAEAASQGLDLEVSTLRTTETVARTITHEIHGSTEIQVSRADAQIAIIPPLTLSSLTSGNTPGFLNSSYTDDNPDSENYLWADDSDSHWTIGTVPSSLRGTPMIHTKVADKATTGSSTVVSFTLSDYAQVIVWHDDSETTKPAWLTSGYQDCGLDLVDSTGTYSGYAGTKTGTINLGGNCATGGCAASPNMYLVSYTPSAFSLCSLNAPSSPGTVEFSSAGYTGDELTTLTFTVERNGGCDGAGSVTVAEGTNPSNGILNTASATWGDGDCSDQTGTVDLADIGPGDDTMTLALSSPSGVSLGTITTTTLTIHDLDSPTSSADFYVNKGDGSCSDVANDGSSKTFVSGTTGPFCTISRGNASPAGSTIGVVTGDYYDDPINPGAANLTYQPEDGDVTLHGPMTGSRTDIVTCNQSGMEILHNGSYNWLYDGGVTWGTNVSKGGDPTTVAGIKQGGSLGDACDNAVIEITGSNTAGWNGWLIGSGVNNFTSRISFTGAHGYVAVPGGDDFGDYYWFNIDYPNTVWLDGCDFSAGISYKNSGHSLGHFQDSKLLGGCTSWDNDWSSVSSWDSGDGNRVYSFTRDVQGGFYDIIINRNGYSPDNSHVSCAKHESTRAYLSIGVVRNCIEWGHNIASADWSHHARAGHFYHLIYQNVGSVIWYIRQYSEQTCAGCAGWSELEGYVGKNIVILDFDTDGGGDDLFEITDADGQTYCQNGGACDDTLTNHWYDMFQLDGVLIENATGDCADVYGTVSGDGRQSLDWFMFNYPALFSNITCTTDAGYGNAPAAGTDTTFANFETQWTPTVTTLVNGQGVDLTVTTNSGTNSTNVCVEDGVGFPDPDGRTISTAAGQLGSFGAWEINLNGTNVAYTDFVYDGEYPTISGCFTLASPTSWGIGDPVNFPITTGSSPNLGAVL